MKAIFTLIITVFITTSSYSQRISLLNLIKVQNMTVVDAEDLLLGLGFRHVKEYGKLEEFETYQFQKNSDTSIDYIAVSKYLYKGKNIYTSLFTLHKSDYSILKQGLSSLGYKFIETTKHDTGIRHVYKKAEIEIVLRISQTEDNISMYSVDIVNIPNQEFYYNNTF